MFLLLIQWDPQRPRFLEIIIRQETFNIFIFKSKFQVSTKFCKRLEYSSCKYFDIFVFLDLHFLLISASCSAKNRKRKTGNIIWGNVLMGNICTVVQKVQNVSKITQKVILVFKYIKIAKFNEKFVLYVYSWIFWVNAFKFAIKIVF